MRERPNILIIKADQHNARCMGVSGHSQVKTPNLDALASQGVRFTNAFVQNPICSPSRACYLSGQYVHNHGLFGLSEGEHMPAGLPSLFSVLKAAGYYTGIVGHIHVPEDWLRPHCDMYRDLFHPHDNAYNDYLEAKGLRHLRDDVDYKGKGQIYEGGPSELSFEDSNEGYCLKSFEEHLARTPQGVPFLFQLDCVHPHENYFPAKEFWEMYEGADFELPPSADEDLSSKPPHQQAELKWVRTEYNGWVFEPKTYAAGRLRKLRGYYGCVSQVDHMVGLAIEKLKALGLRENTIVLYCADHGEFALEHGLLEKAPGISYDAVLRTPFIWSWPKGDLGRGVIHELVESVDVLPTLCALTGLETPRTVDGKDLSAMLRGSARPIRDFVVAEFPLGRTIRTKEWKLCHYPRKMFPGVDDIGELYHISEDPWEMTNLYHAPEHRAIREDLRRTLFDWTEYTSRYGCTWPPCEKGEDGKTTVAGLQKLLKDGTVNYL